MVRLTKAFDPARMMATEPATGSKASQPGKRMSDANNLADTKMAAMPAKEITCLRPALRAISRRQASNAPASSSQKRETGREKSLHMSGGESAVLTQKEAPASPNLKRPNPAFNLKEDQTSG